MKSVMEEEFPDLGNLGDTIAKATQDAKPRSYNFWSWKICQPFCWFWEIHEKHIICFLGFGYENLQNWMDMMCFFSYFLVLGGGVKVDETAIQATPEIFWSLMADLIRNLGGFNEFSFKTLPRVMMKIWVE